jgi:tetratricopeptide (TPR) repeat protein
VAVQTGRLSEAKKRYEQCLALAEQQAKANPTSAAAQRDVSVSYNKLGDVAVQIGQLSEAKKRYEQGLALAGQLAKANPTSAEAQRDLAVSHCRLASLTKLASHWQAAARILQSLKSQGRLAPADEGWLTEVSSQALGQR